MTNNDKPVSPDLDRRKKLVAWTALTLLTFSSVYLFFFFEWLFDITKPSFMELMPWWTQLGILLFSGLVVALACQAIVLALFGLSLIPGLARAWKVFLFAGGILPATFLAATALMLIDNFTYTVFKFGIVTAQGIQRGIYAAVFTLILAGCLFWVTRTLTRQARRKRLRPVLRFEQAAFSVILIASFALGANLYHGDPTSYSIPITGSAVQRPNILLIGSDSMEASHMSLYGAQRDTTPFLRSIASQSLLAENNFPNANETAGSLISMFTGKLPSDTRVLYPPDILQGDDAFQHFPGILKNLGYYNAEISVDYYGDVTVMNLQNSFDLVNGRTTTPSPLYTLTRQYIPDNAAYFISSVGSGLIDRLEHISYVRSMNNPYAEVTLGPTVMDDQPRIDQVLSLFRNVQQPLFIHVYMMATHLGSLDGYDDAIQGYDGYMQQVYNALQQMGKLDQTIIIYYTDNGFGDVSNTRIPLMIRFPNGQYAGTYTNNTQNLDIGPTILDYLGIQQPDWMSGQSLLKGQPAANTPIFSASPNYLKGNLQNELQLDPSKIKPPFNQFGTFTMVVCQKWYAIDTSQMAWNEGDVTGDATACPADQVPTGDQAKQILLDRLRSDGFDVSSLYAALNVVPAQ